MRWTTAKVRQSFLDFFKKRGHEIVPSASLIPKGDATLLFTNAGMVPFKDYFLGIRTPTARRVVDCQKCLRISGKHNDLEAVGRDTYHHTFFEMLGNWSFGDYYKREAIQWHWELITKVWGVSPELLWATVHKDDQESEDIWHSLNALPKERILRFGDKDNFWEMGETGPCGPNSEIDIDRGPAACDGSTHAGVACAVNVDGCERFIELGNLVFIQYNRDSTGKLTPLPEKHVDTGSGLERITAALQSIEEGRVLGNYDIDLFRAIIAKIEEFAGGEPAEREIGPTKLSYGFKFGNEQYNAEVDAAFRMIADHARAITFLISDGVIPGNGDREYVLRRLIRRAVRRGRSRLMIEKPFLGEVCASVVEAMGDFYSELNTQRQKIVAVVAEEERRFSETLERGLALLYSEESQLTKLGTSTLPGDIAFKLYDTYGFPLDLTQEILREQNLSVDLAGFERLMNEQRERARSARKEDTAAPEIQLGAGTSSRFVGYHEYERDAEILAANGKDDSIAVVVAETPFYPEGGGQVGDRGIIEAESGALLEIVDTRKAEGSIVHIGKLLRGEAGEFEKGRRVHLKVDRERRDASMRNHSATHILHYALRDVLGKGVHQAGSLVDPNRLRFDFHHNGAISEGDLETIEEEINARIRENAAVRFDEMAYDDAIKAGALAFFGDKYGDRVRVIRMGDFSVELCGGTHVDATGQIGIFKLEAESGIAAGVRRVEALTGQGALEAVRKREKILDDIGHYLGARDAQALDRLEKLVNREKELEKKLRALEQKLASGASNGGAGGGETVVVANGVKIVTRKLEGIEARSLRDIADRMRQQHGSCVVVIGSDLGDKVALVVAVTPDLTSKLKAGDIIKEIAPIVGGSGGGRPDFAQAGGKDPSKLDEALAHVASLIK